MFFLSYKMLKISTRQDRQLRMCRNCHATLGMRFNLVPRGCIPFGQHQGCKTSGIINVKMLANRNLIGYYILPEVYEKEVSKQEIKILRMLLLDVFDHVKEGQWERNLKMGDAN